MQADTLFLRDLSGRGIYQLTVCDPVSKLTATELGRKPTAGTAPGNARCSDCVQLLDSCGYRWRMSPSCDTR